MRKYKLLAIIFLMLGIALELPAQKNNIGYSNLIKPIINAFYSGEQYDIRLLDIKETSNDNIESNDNEIFYFEVYEATKISMEFSRLTYENNVPQTFYPYTVVNISIFNCNAKTASPLYSFTQRITTGSLSSFFYNDNVTLSTGIYGLELSVMQSNFQLDPDDIRPIPRTISSLPLPPDFKPEVLPYRKYGLWANLYVQNLTPVEEKYSNISNPDIAYLHSLNRFPNKNMVCVLRSHDGSNSDGSLSVDYYDDLGRLDQTVNKKFTPKMKDLVVWQEYDLWGRKGNTWLPIVTMQNDGAYVQGELYRGQSLKTYGGDDCAFTSYVYESSPLQKLAEQCGPGSDWHRHNKAIKVSEFANVIGNDTLDCFSFQFTDGVKEALSISAGKKYHNGSLLVTRTEDEDGKTEFEFKDNFDRVVLSRQVEAIAGSKQVFDTYYVYDDLGQLRAVLPPALSECLSVGAVDPQFLEQYAYLYKYDKAGNQSAKKLPGISWEYYLYDKNNRMIFSQNGVEREKGECQFYISDSFGRLCLQGICQNQVDPFDGKMLNTSVTCTYIGMTQYEGYILNQTGLINMSLYNPVIRTVNYYDNYNFMNYDRFESGAKLDYISKTGFCEKYANPKGFLTGTLVICLDASDEASELNYKRSVIYYDDRNRIIQSVSNNHLDGIERDYFNYNFAGNIISRLHEHTGSNNYCLSEQYTYCYDSEERLMHVVHKLNGQPEVMLSAYEYDELGRLQSKSLHDRFLDITYEYNIRNWLAKIKSPLFNQTMHYTDGVGIPCYNGNISSMIWKGGNEMAERGYKFTYDGLSRLKNAIYGEGTSLSTNLNLFNEQILEYDKMGNILGLLRYGQKSVTDYGLVDNLNLTYNGNQLKKVTDAVIGSAYKGGFEFKDSADQAMEYEYDKNGNLTKDLNKKVADIQYNSLNLPNRIEFENGNVVSYMYDAAGTKLSVMHIMGNDSTVTDYCGNVIYENGVAKTLLTEAGYISLKDGRYHYFIQDHQGNNRVVIDQYGTVEETNHYYPLGGVFAPTASVQSYKYNGKEFDNENGLNWYDYGARHYDTAIGRWHVMDPSSEKYYGVSSYVYCANNSVNYIDPDGRDWYWDKDKTRQFNPDLNKDNQDAILQKGQTYIGATDAVKNSNGSVIENYRNDGSIMFSSEASGYKRMITNSLKTGNEEMGVITDKGVLVVPNYKNSKSEVNLADYGYSINNGNIVDKRGIGYNTIATAHTHPDGSGPSTYTVNSWGDLGFAANATPNKPVFVFQLNGMNAISVIHSASTNGKMTESFSQFARIGITSGIPNINLKTIQNGNVSLRRFTREYNDYFRTFYNK